MLMILQVGAQAEATQKDIQIAQEVVIAIIAASTIVVLGLLLLMGHFARKAPTNEGALHYGNSFVVIFGIMTALIGFLIAFPLVVSPEFTDPTQVIALLSAVFGTIVGLVGTCFGVKSSSDAGQQAQNIAAGSNPWNTALPGGLPGGPTGGAPNGAASGTSTATTSDHPAELASRRSMATGSATEPGEESTQNS